MWQELSIRLYRKEKVLSLLKHGNFIFHEKGGYFLTQSCITSWIAFKVLPCLVSLIAMILLYDLPEFFPIINNKN